MGMMDNIKGKMSDMDFDNMDRTTMMQHIDRLQQKEADGTADDSDRSMLEKLKQRLNTSGM